MKELQKKIKNFCKENNLNAPVEHRLLDLMSELGEVAKEALKMTDYGTKKAVKREEMKSEMGDLLYVLIVLANSLDIDLDEALNLVLEKYKRRLKKGSPDSFND